MKTVKGIVAATSMFGMLIAGGFLYQTSVGLAMQGEKNMATKAAENVPQNIQRSAPAGNEFPGSGSGPGSRGGDLVDTEKAKSAIKAQSGSGEKNVPGTIQRSTPAGNEFPGSGTGPGSRKDKLTEMEQVEPKSQE